jgi:hypothetical protein
MDDLESANGKNAGRESVLPVTLSCTFNRGYWRRCILAFGLMSLLNALPLYFTWKASGYDGCECIGWPWAFYQRCGPNPEEYYLLLFLYDLVIALFASHLSATCVTNGVQNGFRTLFLE